MLQEQLVGKLQEKDENAFGTLYKMYSESILGVIYTIVKDQELSEEVLQDVFMKVWNNAASYDPKKGRFFTWILNIARNAAIDKIRSKSYNNSKQNLTADYFVDILESNDNLDSRMDALGIKKYVARLKKKCTKLIDLLYFKGFTQKEAAEVIEIPIGTVKTRIRKCVLELRELIS